MIDAEFWKEEQFLFNFVGDTKVTKGKSRTIQSYWKGGSSAKSLKQRNSSFNNFQNLLCQISSI